MGDFTNNLIVIGKLVTAKTKCHYFMHLHRHTHKERFQLIAFASLSQPLLDMIQFTTQHID